MSRRLIDNRSYFESLRSSGYRTTGAAIAELIDNSIDSGATEIRVECVLDGQSGYIAVQDNGRGMTGPNLIESIRLGGSTKRRNSDALGRFGVGLTNAAVSLARSLTVYSYRTTTHVYKTHLNLNDVFAGRQNAIPVPKRAAWPEHIERLKSKSGSLVLLENLDLLREKYQRPLEKKLISAFGRTYRYKLQDGIQILMNGQPVSPNDPLFLDAPHFGESAKRYGEDLLLRLSTVDPAPHQAKESTVRIRFSELPIEAWHNLTPLEKATHGISRNLGISILRNGREIDTGWYFFGKKRKENYDDWWRCELAFNSDLDESFGVTNTKQGISPRPVLDAAISSHLESIAYTLNNRVKKRFQVLRKAGMKCPATKLANNSEPTNPMPIRGRVRAKKSHANTRHPLRDNVNYRLVYEEADMEDLFTTVISDQEILTIINTLHPFGQQMHSIRESQQGGDELTAIDLLELFILASSRVSATKSTPKADRHTALCSSTLTAMLG